MLIFPHSPRIGIDFYIIYKYSILIESMNNKIISRIIPSLLLLLLYTQLYAQTTESPIVKRGLFKNKALSQVQENGLKSNERYIPRYESGQGSVGLGAGVAFPLFFQKVTGEIADTRLSLGGHMWFEWDIFLWQGLSAGMEIAGMFSLTKNSRTLFMAPITAHIKYTFQIYPIEFPVGFSIGMNMSSLESLFKADIIAKPKIGITYRINQNWAAGLYSSYWFVFQDYGLNDNLGSEYSRFAHFLDTTAGFSYVF